MDVWKMDRDRSACPHGLQSATRLAVRRCTGRSLGQPERRPPDNGGSLLISFVGRGPAYAWWTAVHHSRRSRGLVSIGHLVPRFHQKVTGHRWPFPWWFRELFISIPSKQWWTPVVDISSLLDWGLLPFCCFLWAYMCPIVAIRSEYVRLYSRDLVLFASQRGCRIDYTSKWVVWYSHRLTNFQL